MSLACITPGCMKIKHKRGLCMTCYTKLFQAIRAGEDSWGMALLEGRILPVDEKRRSRWGGGRGR
jgi:hypothetical protein